MLLHVIRRNSAYATASDDLLAGLVPDTLVDNLLPFDFLDDFKWPHQARLELSDGVSYITGTEAQREAVVKATGRPRRPQPGASAIPVGNRAIAMANGSAPN